ncbi:MAG: dipeptide epimerase [Flavobacteriaceae bacterium]
MIYLPTSKGTRKEAEAAQMKLSYYKILLKKRFPLAISRGVRGDSYNVFVALEKEGIVGWGEAAPGKNENADSPEKVIEELERLVQSGIEGLSIYEIEARARSMQIAPCAYAGLDIALWDWKAKKAQMPLYQLLGFPKPKIATSVTIGINPPEVVKERVPLLLEGTGVQSLKIKLGSPEGVMADKAMFEQVVASCMNYDVKVRVDANGGWDLSTAVDMSHWLAERGVTYIEQPLKEGEEANLTPLYQQSALPIYVDESCRFANNIPQWAHSVHGVNFKLMKCGGITEALRIIATAQAFGLKTMVGCMSESSLSIAAAAALSGILDHIDLDSHYNLAPDPAEGAPLIDGITMPTDKIGHGAKLIDQHNVTTEG